MSALALPLHSLHSVVGGRGAIDREAAELAIRDLLRALGHNPNGEHLVDTPRRVAEAYVELLTPRAFNPTTFANEERYDELVLARDIPFVSLCQHHLLPFTGVAHVGYLPDTRILGLSKLARVVELFARDLQVQERLTQQVANWLSETVAPKGVGVVLEAEHQCMSLRGVGASGSRTMTSALHGCLRDNAAARAEFFSHRHASAIGWPAMTGTLETPTHDGKHTRRTFTTERQRDE